MASSLSEVETIYKKFYPLMVNKRKNHQKRQKVKAPTAWQVSELQRAQLKHPK